jgi:uncharacterized protein YjiS (DUF1127 family)
MAMMTTLVGARGRAAVDLGAVLRGVVAAVAREWRTRREVAFLMRQDERMLRDIGVSRSEIERAVRGGRN